MKVCQEIDVDNVTIIINPQNKLEAKIPPTSSEVVIEEVTSITNYHDGGGNQVNQPFSITKGGATYPITKVGRIKGTDWLVLHADGLLGSTGGDTGGDTGDDTDTPTVLPTFNVSSHGNDTLIFINGNTVTNSEGAVRFEFHADMSAYATAGYKVYGVIKNDEATIYEAPLDDISQRSSLGSADIQYSEISHAWISGIIGKTLNLTNLTVHVYLMNDAGDKVYPANRPNGYVSGLPMRVQMAAD